MSAAVAHPEIGTDAQGRIYVVETIPACCTSDDVCRLLDLSKAQFFHLRKQGRFPIPEITPRIDSRPRFAGEKVRAYIVGRSRESK